MNSIPEKTISDEELEILQEIMNIAMGRATADLAEIIDIYIRLSVPFIKILNVTELPEYIKDEIKDYDKISLVEQNFWGNFKGVSLLVFPYGAGKELISLMSSEALDSFESDPIIELEKETLMEVGNIIIGACLGKIAELLNDVITFSPPKVLVEDHPHDAIPKTLFNANNTVIMLKTVFSFEKKDIKGFLFLMAHQDSITLLQKALDDFMRQYE